MSAQNLLQNMLVNNTKTGNQLLDYFLNFALLSFITYMFQNIKFVKNLLINYLHFLFKKIKIFHILL
jgi:hypothetical protein